ncbi:hypothetical protein PV11_03448 [Exophiala sideris]|uniref:1-alkyl-2-acetylglycerophosphocholine esterase n=1 Tax=Exophiala sideris TaxID=1016849 RepID=A0A0D1ZMD5_9EURO|nr:hypothetical protein PV11_03448 [Exophiala sideris]
MHSAVPTLLMLAAGALATFIIPQPSGPYGVSLIDVELVDKTRRDPYTNASERIIPISVISPAGLAATCHHTIQSYMVNATATYWEEGLPFINASISLNNTFTQTELSLCTPVPACQSDYPVILFSPALGTSRQFYHIQCTNLASQGYNVITVEAPGQVDVLTLADGSIQYADTEDIDDDETATAAVDVRVTDLNFVLNTLSSPAFAQAHPNIQLNTSEVAIFGHSLGGAASLASIVNNTRFLGGADFDGAIYGPPLSHTTTKPFILFTSSPHNQSLAATNWAAAWKNLVGWRLQLQLADSMHYSFSDYPLLLETWGIANASTKEILAPLVGTIDGRQALTRIVDIMHTFFKFVFSQGSVQGLVVVAEAKTLGDFAVVNGTNT